MIHCGESSTGCDTLEHAVSDPAPWANERLELDVVADFREEGWRSMELTAEMLSASAARIPGVQCQLIRPPMWRLSRSGRFPSALERATGRFIQYPLRLAHHERRGQYFHIADHSYAHLVHVLPARRVGVYCHDIDAFRVLLPRSFGPYAKRVMARCILAGMRSAALVFYSTEAVKDELLANGLLPAARLVNAPYGTAPEFSPQVSDWDAVVRARVGGRYILHVGTCIPRKNTTFLLHLLCRMREEQPALKLLQVGGTWPDPQRTLLAELGLAHAVLQVRDIPRAELAAMYRQAEVVALPSLSEGFGLPMIEALACGTKVLATDLPVFREVGGAAAEYAPESDLGAWVQALRGISRLGRDSFREPCLRQAARYSWNEHARLIVRAYGSLCEREMSGAA